MRTLRIKTVVIAVIFILLSVGSLRSQEMTGIVFSNYSGISSASINPALLTGTKVYLDVNFISGDISFSNNMIYFSRENKTINKAIRIDDAFFYNGQYKYDRAFNYYDNTEDKYFTSNVKMLGPSMMLQLNKHAFGITTTFRSFNSGNHIPYSMPMALYEDLSAEKLQGIEFDDDDYGFVSMTWSEIGLSYAYNAVEHYDNRLTLGLSAKALFGYEGAYAIMHNTNYIIHDQSSVDFKNVDAEIGLALPMSYGDEIASNLEPLVKGYGLGLDFGVVYTKLKSPLGYKGHAKLCARPYSDYVYKIGFSILDIGGINFTKNTMLHTFDNVSKEWSDFDTIQYKGISSQLQTFSEGFYGDAEKSHTGDKIRINLPATISLQFDYHLKENIYLSALWTQPLRFNDYTLWRPSQISFIPRFENNNFGVSVPMSLFNYSEPRIGLAFRFSYVTIGTERIGSLLGISDLSGMDFYFSFRFSLSKGGCSMLNATARNRNWQSDW